MADTISVPDFAAKGLRIALPFLLAQKVLLPIGFAPFDYLHFTPGFGGSS
jgi:hypothetical protein